MKHTILYVAANPQDTDRLALDEECAAIERELRMTSGRDDFEFRSKWAVSVDELMRHLNELEPTILHFSGHGCTDDAGPASESGDPRRDVSGAPAGRAGILLQDGPSRQYVSDRTLAKMIAAAAPSTRVVVLNACYSVQVADALRGEVDCVVGIDGAIADTAARSFAVAFYRALGHRRSIGNAVEQAAAVLEAKHPGARAQCTTRDDLEADRMFLPSVEPGPLDEAPLPRPAPPVAARGSASRVDIGVLTIRDDEFRAVLAAFPDKIGIHKGTSREYALCAADAGAGKCYRIAVSRLIEQGNGEAQDAARDLIDDLTPRLVLVVGIAGAPPSEDVKLGDVVVSTRIHDFTVEARKAGADPTYSVTGGPIDKALAAFVTNLAAHDHELGDWTAQLTPPPPVAWEAADRLYGPAGLATRAARQAVVSLRSECGRRARVRHRTDRRQRSPGEGPRAAHPVAPDRARPARDRDGIGRRVPRRAGALPDARDPRHQRHRRAEAIRCLDQVRVRVGRGVQPRVSADASHRGPSVAPTSIGSRTWNVVARPAAGVR